MAGSGASQVLSRLVQHSKNQKPIISSDSAKSVTRVIFDHLNADRLSKAVSVLFASPEPVHHSLYERLFHLCSLKSAIVEARKVESHLVTFSPLPPIFLLNRAIETYGKCGCLDDARELFEEMPARDGGSWNALIAACARNDSADEALHLYLGMNREGVRSNEITFASVLGSCGLTLGLSVLAQFHGLIVKKGFSGNVILETSIVDVYGKCGDMSSARKMFDEIKHPNYISWNVIVRRYLEVGDGRESVIMFFKMFKQKVWPLNHTVSNAIVACTTMLALKEGMEIHGVAIKINFEEDDVVSSSLIDMYMKCKQLESARRIFDCTESKDLITWTSIISGYASSGQTVEARELFDIMPERNMISWNAMLAGYVRSLQWDEALEFITLMLREADRLDHVSHILILNVCSGLSDVEMGKRLHGFIYRHGFNTNLLVANALLVMYGRCGNLRSASRWFHQMSEWRDMVSWNALLTSFARLGRSEHALSFFEGMQLEAKPSKFTFGTLLAGCANISALKQGKEIHGFMIRNFYDMDVVIRGAMVDMYSKCRCLDYALLVFKEAGLRDLILWNSIILGCCHNGRSREVFGLIVMMEEEGVKPDHVTFQGILLACLHEGHVELGRRYFNSMSREYFIIPRMEHYDCMIDLYCKHGCMEEIKEFLREMPFDPTVEMLTKVLAACRKHGSLELGEWAAERLKESNSSVIEMAS